MEKLKRYLGVVIVAALASLLLQGFIDLAWLPRFILNVGVIGLAAYISHSILRTRAGRHKD